MIKGILQIILVMVVTLFVCVAVGLGIELGLGFIGTLQMVGVWIMAALFLLPIAFGMFDYKIK